MSKLIPAEIIEKRIYFIRGKKVMLDFELAALYGVKTRQLKRQVRRNIRRFPADFMIQLSREEYQLLRCQFGTLKRGAHTKYLPYAFSEQGVAMLSSVLNSEMAIAVNIQIMRAFVKLREMLSPQKKLLKKINVMENKYDKQFKVVFDVIKALVKEPEEKPKRIGFLRGN